MLAFEEIGSLGVAAISECFRSREVSPVEVARAMLERIEALNPKLNLCYYVAHATALAEAQASEKRWSEGATLGVLDGIPTTVKDGLPSVGVPSYRGSAAQLVDDQQVWETDAPVVARSREAGMVILGKTPMPDFGILASGTSSKHGITRNPWNPERNPGGSSSGAAACVASGIGPVVAGTDIVGSIRLPASFCGLFGHKPSQGRVPYFPPSAPTLVAGPMSRSVEDAALYMNAIARPDARDFTALSYDARDYTKGLDAPVEGARLGLVTDIGFGPGVHPEVSAAVERAAALLGDSGHPVEILETPFARGDEAPAELFYRMRCFTEFSNFDPELRARAKVIDEWTRPMAEVKGAELFRAMDGMRSLQERSMRLFEGIDYLLLPSVAIPAFEAELPAPDPKDLFAPWSNTFLFNITQQPAASINCGYTRSGLPIGLQIVGQRFDDMGVFRIAREYEQARPPQEDWPLL